MKLYAVDHAEWNGASEGGDQREWFTALRPAVRRFRELRRLYWPETPGGLPSGSVSLERYAVPRSKVGLVAALNSGLWSCSTTLAEYPEEGADDR